MKYLIYFSLLASLGCKADFTDSQKTVINDIIWAADTVGVPRGLLLAICYHEGQFRSDPALSHMDGGSLTHGTCQVKLRAASYVDSLYRHPFSATSNGLKVPPVNAFYAAKYLKYQLSRYSGNWKKAVDAYNKGSLYSTNSAYVNKVKKSLQFVQQNIKVIL